MSYFVFDGVIQLQQPFVIKGEEASHIARSRRIQTGGIIQIQDQSDLRYQARIEQIGKKSLRLLPLTSQTTPPEPLFRINLYQALVKEKALDYIIQKTTELGVASIYLFQNRYSQRLKPDDEQGRKQTRWKKIAREACKQSGRVKPPEITILPDLSKLEQVLESPSTKTMATICLTSSGDTIPLDQASIASDEINLLIGSEGGWNDDEMARIECERVHLGPRILRSDTAAVSAVGILQYVFGDMRNPSILRNRCG